STLQRQPRLDPRNTVSGPVTCALRKTDMSSRPSMNGSPSHRPRRALSSGFRDAAHGNSLRHGFPARASLAYLLSLQHSLNSTADVGLVTFQEAEPECSIRFDDLQGEPRNCDWLSSANRALELWLSTSKALA